MKNRNEKLAELRELVMNYPGPIRESPHYEEFAMLAISECIVGRSKQAD